MYYLYLSGKSSQFNNNNLCCAFNLEHGTHTEPKFAINQTKSINERFELELHTYTHTHARLCTSWYWVFFLNFVHTLTAFVQAKISNELLPRLQNIVTVCCEIIIQAKWKFYSKFIKNNMSLMENNFPSKYNIGLKCKRGTSIATIVIILSFNISKQMDGSLGNDSILIIQLKHTNPIIYERLHDSFVFMFLAKNINFVGIFAHQFNAQNISIETHLLLLVLLLHPPHMASDKWTTWNVCAHGSYDEVFAPNWISSNIKLFILQTFID